MIKPPSKPPRSADHFLSCLQDIEKAGHMLQQALIKRHNDGIWQAIELQESSMQRFAQCYREYYGHDDEPIPPSESDSLIKDVIRRIKNVYRTNRALAHSFLEVIDRTLSGLSATQGGNPFVYDSTGRIGSGNGPLLVQQKG
jgi:hypothetical protein